jgi:hypothetical protein
MAKSYEYNGFTLEVSVEFDVNFWPDKRMHARDGYVGVVRIFKGGDVVAIFSQLRFGETRGRPFSIETDALVGGQSVGCKS